MKTWNENMKWKHEMKTWNENMTWKHEMKRQNNNCFVDLPCTRERQYNTGSRGSNFIFRTDSENTKPEK